VVRAWTALTILSKFSIECRLTLSLADASGLPGDGPLTV
jgi:hypothetical protein